MSASRPDTWMPMFWGDYFKKTNHLSTVEHGAYMLLIGHYWTTGRPLPDDDAVLARITRQSLAAWRRMREVIAPFFDPVDGRWQHERIDAEIDRATRFIEKQTANGARGGRPPRTETQTKPNPKPKPNPTGTTSPSPANILNHGDIPFDAARASASPDGPPHARLPDSAKWKDRLEQFKPWLPHGERGKWEATWGPRPDSAGRNPIIPPALYADWRAKYDAAMETQTA